MTELKIVSRNEALTEPKSWPAKFAAYCQKLIEIWHEECAAPRCKCSRKKVRRDPFCNQCRLAIPKEIRAGMLGPDALTNAESYRDSVKYLEENGYMGKGATASLFGNEQ